MKKIVFIFCLFLSLISQAQLSGDISIDQRKITDSISYEMEMNTTGTFVFDIAVNVKGVVTSCQWNKFESTIASTRYAYQAKNIILTQLKFEAGNGYPKHHQGKVTITAVLPENK